MYSIIFNIPQRINKGFKVPKQIYTNREFLQKHNAFLATLKDDSLELSTKLLGGLFNYIFPNLKITDNQIKIANYIIMRMRCKGNKNKKISELINILYSAIIKKIDANTIMSGDVSPEVYKSLIDESIKNYRKHPVGDMIDYRHIAGRMLNLKNLSNDIHCKLGKIPNEYSALQWNEEIQLNYLGVLEKITNNYEKSTNNCFKVKNFLKILETGGQDKYTYDIHVRTFNLNVREFLEQTLKEVKKLMEDPIKNKEEIQDSLDIAYTYFDKVPYSAQSMPSTMPYYIKLKEQEKILSEFIKKEKVEIRAKRKHFK